MKPLLALVLFLSGSVMARTHAKKDSPRLPRWYCTAHTNDDEHVSHSNVSTTQAPAKRNALKECRYFHPDSEGCRVRCWKL